MTETRDRNELVVKILAHHDEIYEEMSGVGVDEMYRKGYNHALYWVLEFCLAFYSEPALHDEDWQKWRPPDFPSPELNRTP